MTKTARKTGTEVQPTTAARPDRATSEPPLVRVFDPQEARRKLSELDTRINLALPRVS